MDATRGDGRPSPRTRKMWEAAAQHGASSGGGEAERQQ
jgi:hypothetical protein